MAEIHRCFSLLGKGGLSCHNMQSAVSQGQGGETGAGRTGYDVQTWDPESGLLYPRAHPRPCSQAGAHPALSIRTEQVQDTLDASSAHVQPYATILKPEIKALCLPGGPLPTPKPTHSVRALSRNWCFVCCPWRSWRRNTWPGMPWSFRLRSFTCSSAILAWTKTANFPSLQDQRRRGQPGPHPQDEVSSDCKRGEGVSCPSRTLLKETWLHRAPLPWQPAKSLKGTGAPFVPAH